AETLAGGNGLKGKLAQPLAEDAAFLRKLKPSLMAARARGEAPTNQKPGSGAVAPSAPQLGERPKPPKPKKAGGPNPWLVAGAAIFSVFMLGFLLAAAAAALATAMATWLALLLVALALLLLTGLLGLLALRSVRRGTPPVPRQAIREAKLTQDALKSDART